MKILCFRNLEFNSVPAKSIGNNQYQLVEQSSPINFPLKFVLVPEMRHCDRTYTLLSFELD